MSFVDTGFFIPTSLTNGITLVKLGLDATAETFIEKGLEISVVNGTPSALELKKVFELEISFKNGVYTITENKKKMSPTKFSDWMEENWEREQSEEIRLRAQRKEANRAIVLKEFAFRVDSIAQAEKIANTNTDKEYRSRQLNSIRDRKKNFEIQVSQAVEKKTREESLARQNTFKAVLETVDLGGFDSIFYRLFGRF